MPIACHTDLVNPKTVYLMLCLLGIALPYWAFVPWIAENGLNLRLFFEHLFANRISEFFAADVLISAVVLIRFIRVERSRIPIPLWWLPSIAVLTVAVCLALPLTLYLRESGTAKVRPEIEPRLR